MKTTENTKYERALKRVERIKKFYKHVRVYIIINIIFLLLKVKILSVIKNGDFSDVQFEHWLNLNVYGTALIWGVGLLLHGLYVFQNKFTFFKNWEERKLKEILEQEENNL
tara:strand:+ start:147 stop:479 length:333 start_codon:yes stop_codon:yes gene_type:complete